MDGVTITPLRQIANAKGDIFHVMKKSDEGFFGFGEAYFSTIKTGEVKGWKKHLDMTLNIVVITGEVKFVIYDGKIFYSVNLSKGNYQRLTIKPGLWLAFKGVADDNILLNLANIEHDPDESESYDLNFLTYDWHLKE